MGKGFSQVQAESRQAYLSMKDVLDLAIACYEQWEEKNRFSSAIRDKGEFDALLPHKELGLRAVFCMMRGGKGGHLFSTIRKLLENIGKPDVDIPKADYGKIRIITGHYLRYADEHFPPSVIELHWSAMFAAEQADQSMYSVAVPDTEGNYGGTYFSGTLDNALGQYETARKLREQAVAMLLKQQEQWKDER